MLIELAHLFLGDNMPDNSQESSLFSKWTSPSGIIAVIGFIGLFFKINSGVNHVTQDVREVQSNIFQLTKDIATLSDSSLRIAIMQSQYENSLKELKRVVTQQEEDLSSIETQLARLEEQMKNKHLGFQP